MKTVAWIILFMGIVGIWWVFADHDPRPICRTSTWLQTPEDYKPELKYLRSEKTKCRYKYIFESDDCRDFDIAEYLKTHDDDLVYTSNSGDPNLPLTLLIFSNNHLDERFLRREKP